MNQQVPVKMSFFDGTLNKDVLRQIIEETEMEIRYTHGLSYRNPTTNKVLVSKERALEIVDQESYLNANEKDNVLYLNSYSDNDLW